MSAFVWTAGVPPSREGRRNAMAGVAVLGFGVVGAGVVGLLEQNAGRVAEKAGQAVTLKYILDIRAFPDSPYAGFLVQDFAIIENDPEVQVVVECIGGVGAALTFTRRALLAGKHVVTTNKELVAEHGAELQSIAAARNLNYLFEGSVGGGIPVLRPLSQCLAANHIREITGILNGTTNYVLTQMIRAGVSFEEALAGAQSLGYAEADPSDDIHGKDTCRKICILASLAFGRHVYPEQVATEGIAGITRADVSFAHAHGCQIKLLGRALPGPDGGLACLYVAPHFVRDEHPLAGVHDVFNGIWMEGDAIGEVMFYGRGAGALPTASAVVADIIDSVKHMSARKWVGWQPAVSRTPLTDEDLRTAWYVRLDEAGGAITEPMTRAERTVWEATLPHPPAGCMRIL